MPRKSIRVLAPELKPRCPAGHIKWGENVITKTSRGRVYEGCRRCATDHVIAYQRRQRGGIPPRSTPRNEARIPLTPYLMRALLGLHEARGREVDARGLAERIGLDVSVVYAYVERLTKRSLTTARYERRKDPQSGKLYRYAQYKLTPSGQRFTAEWLTFIKRLGRVADLLDFE